MPIDEQDLPWICSQDQHQRWTVQNDGKHQQVSLALFNDTNSCQNKRNYNNTFYFSFQQALKKYGVADIDVFQTVDLWDQKDIAQITSTLFALGRQVTCSNMCNIFKILPFFSNISIFFTDLQTPRVERTLFGT